MSSNRSVTALGEVKTLPDHEYLLYQRGFLSQEFLITKTAGFLLDELENKYENCRESATKTGKPTQFYFGFTVYLGHQKEKVDMKLKYSYDPQTPSLRITSLRSRMGIERKLYLLKSNTDLPEIKGIHYRLYELAQVRRWQLLKNGDQIRQQVSKLHTQRH